MSSTCRPPGNGDPGAPVLALTPPKRARLPQSDPGVPLRRSVTYNPATLYSELEPLLPRRPNSALAIMETGSWSLSRVPPPLPGERIGVFRGTCMLMSMMLGAGLFISPGVVLQYVGSVPLALGAYVFGGALCMVGALCYAELG
eukprot:RCo027947